MPHVRSRDDDSGRPRYTAYYRDIHSKQKSAGTFDTLKQARDAGTEAQARVLDGRFLDTASGKLTFERYTTTVWLPNLTFEATTRQGYAFVVHKYLLDFFGPIRMNQIMPGAIREYYALLLDAGVGVSTVHKAKTVLCSIFNTAVNDRVIALHPCHGVPAPREPVRRRTILSPAQYQRIRHHLPETWRLLTDLALDSACRWGELAELHTHGTLYAYTIGQCRCETCQGRDGRLPRRPPLPRLRPPHHAPSDGLRAAPVQRLVPPPHLATRRTQDRNHHTHYDS